MNSRRANGTGVLGGMITATGPAVCWALGPLRTRRAVARRPSPPPVSRPQLLDGRAARSDPTQTRCAGPARVPQRAGSRAMPVSQVSGRPHPRSGGTAICRRGRDGRTPLSPARRSHSVDIYTYRRCGCRTSDGPRAVAAMQLETWNTEEIARKAGETLIERATERPRLPAVNLPPALLRAHDHVVETAG